MAEKATTELTTGASTPRSGDSAVIIPEARNLLEYWRQPLIEATLTEKDYLRLQCAWLLLKAKQEAGDMGGWSYKLEATSGANPAAPVPLKLRPGVLHTSNI